MAGGIDIRAIYAITCDTCGVRAEPGTEYRSFAEAADARERVSKFDGWLLRWYSTFATLLCPECSARGVRPPV